MKQNILITGIKGSGGSYLAEYILENHSDVEVHGLSRWHSNGSDRNIEAIRDRIVLHECDLLDLSSVIRVLDKIQPTRIFNLASHANVKVCFDNPIAVLNNNINLMANLLEGIRFSCPETIFQQCSTSEVYGNPATVPMTEEHPLKPVNPYSVSKLTQEALAYSYHKAWGLNVIITRMFAYINPRRHDLFATAFARQVAKIEKTRIDGFPIFLLRHGNLASVRTLIDVRDAMESYWVACDYCKPGEAYNIGGHEVLSVGDFLRELLKHSRVFIPTEQDHNLLRPVDVTNQVADVSKFTKLTGWKPKYSLDESIEFLLAHCRKEIQ